MISSYEGVFIIQNSYYTKWRFSNIRKSLLYLAGIRKAIGKEGNTRGSRNHVCVLLHIEGYGVYMGVVFIPV